MALARRGHRERPTCCRMRPVRAMAGAAMPPFAVGGDLSGYRAADVIAR
jgi:hypothetical protein